MGKATKKRGVGKHPVTQGGREYKSKSILIEKAGAKPATLDSKVRRNREGRPKRAPTKNGRKPMSFVERYQKGEGDVKKGV